MKSDILDGQICSTSITLFLKKNLLNEGYQVRG